MKLIGELSKSSSCGMGGETELAPSEKYLRSEDAEKSINTFKKLLQKKIIAKCDS